MGVTHKPKGGALLTGTEYEAADAHIGGTVLYKKAIAYNDANILTGHTIYTPTVGDILLNAWFQIDTAWDGTTPKGDIAQFGLLSTTDPGWFYKNTDRFVGVLMDAADEASAGDQYYSGNYSTNNTWSLVHVGVVGAKRGAPGRFASADPIQYVVTQDAKKGGADPGSTQGAGFIYLVIATPVAL